MMSPQPLTVKTHKKHHGRLPKVGAIEGNTREWYSSGRVKSSHGKSLGSFFFGPRLEENRSSLIEKPERRAKRADPHDQISAAVSSGKMAAQGRGGDAGAWRHGGAMAWLHGGDSPAG
jgi:hypothetical protein